MHPRPPPKAGCPCTVKGSVSPGCRAAQGAVTRVPWEQQGCHELAALLKNSCLCTVALRCSHYMQQRCGQGV